MEPSTEVAAIINDALQASELNQSDLARAVGVTQPTVSRWRSGKSLPDRAHFEAIESALGLDPGTLRAAIGAAEMSMGERLKAMEEEVQELRGLVATLLAQAPREGTDG